MGKNKSKQRNMAIPVENHDTAAWANIADTAPESGVMEPDETQVKNAKEYVDDNEK